ncbi:MAG: hypothetical protein BJ554DRAFT_7628 [Olpidium bornovanus]|uniref:SH3 domain-containing protein n=1 Tax=Olpidium bornovanus TaxID=278681 RepID=A0A8H7ZVU3_9FUNG|nr:MAG: hypothetical protein BJ554DRAFT_7628 [Olpidium bornovanus]
MLRQARRPGRRRFARGSHRAASAAGRKDRVGAMTSALRMAVFVGSMLAHVPAAAALAAADIVEGISSGNVRTVDVAECKAGFIFEGRTVVGCTSLGSPGNVPWCELFNPPANPSLPAWAFCRGAGANTPRPRTGRPTVTSSGQVTGSASRGDRSSNSGGRGSDVGVLGRGSRRNSSEPDYGKGPPSRKGRDGGYGGGGGGGGGDGGGGGGDGGDGRGRGGGDGGADGPGDNGDEGSEEDPGDNGDGGSEEDPGADPGNGGGDEDPGAGPGNGGGEEDPGAGPGNGGGEEDPGADPGNGGDPGSGDSSDPGAIPIPTEVPPAGPTETGPAPTPTGASPPGSPGAAADGNNTGGDDGPGAPQDSNSSNGLSAAAIGAIVVGAVAAASLLLIAPVYLRRKRSAARRAAAAQRASEEKYGSAAPARSPHPLNLAVSNVRSTFASTYSTAPSSESRSNRSSVSSRTTSQYGPDPSTIAFSEAPLGRWMVATNYAPTLSDELAVEPGDIVDVYKKFDDGWVTAVNVSKGFARGVMPMYCLDLDQGQPSPELINERGGSIFL